MPIATEYLIDDLDELLHRNAHPTFIDNGRISSQAFRLTSRDEGRLSIQQNSRAAAAIAYERYTARGLQSGGVWSITVAECGQFTLSVYDDPLEDDDSHAITDLIAYSVSQARKLTNKLASKARERGCQYRPH